ncbi:MAG: ribose-phosphate pyrophosphokinase [Pseudaminobacter sp.]|uniref:Phosphoribosylpyrophosphate synthetase n=1 Tax=Aquamicrobium defluvii TaxID=69279 RepID=A0A011UPS4_9HYPH|nr:ribose-phosphate pyrophosphokinase [Aquamicrobium defluvii]EXL07888.1 phosphoribosylpyrophosphate synthetase [Aquamicrobium defluvii]EZQ14939.1 phosphoribosylpyrophosphate synthetase [Halopseudomonas bauzanensis]TDR34902.1 ribose-phosphate pyrophosphokinase [Aquamicrobium defluvii]
MPPVVFALPGNESMAERLRAALDAESGSLATRNFSDGETYLRFATDPKDRNVVFVCTLDRPDDKALRLLFAADAARDLGASSVGLVAPYLSYMRQDRRFKPGEAITSRTFARLLSTHLDWLVTADPHLHRYTKLGEVYPIPARVVRSTPLLSEWISANVNRPFLLGPDMESKQWVSEVEGLIGAPYQVLRKTRYGDRTVEIAVPDASVVAGHTPVLVDDIVSSGRTMTVVADQLRELGLERPVLVAVHALFSEETYRGLKERAAAVVSANSVVHPSNAIDLSAVLANAVAEAMSGGFSVTSNKEENHK